MAQKQLQQGSGLAPRPKHGYGRTPNAGRQVLQCKVERTQVLRSLPKEGFPITSRPGPLLPSLSPAPTPLPSLPHCRPRPSRKGQKQLSFVLSIVPRRGSHQPGSGWAVFRGGLKACSKAEEEKPHRGLLRCSQNKARPRTSPRESRPSN